jgi:hypothetical protein
LEDDDDDFVPSSNTLFTSDDNNDYYDNIDFDSLTEMKKRYYEREYGITSSDDSNFNKNFQSSSANYPKS